MAKNSLKITDKCVQCGSCLAYGLSFLSSFSDGTVVVKPGTVLEETDKEFQTLKELCPVDAFVLEDEKDEATVVNELIQKLKNFSGLNIPSIKELRFLQEEYEVAVPLAKGEYEYVYKSEEAAEAAARREFDRSMYSQKNAIILKLITEYRVKKISPYYTYEEAEGSLYIRKNQELKMLLEGIYYLFKQYLPSNFTDVSIYPDDDYTWKMLRKGELFSDELIPCVLRELEYSVDYYDCYYKIDYRDVPLGHGKSKYYYCYSNVYEVNRKFAQEILNSCHYADEALSEQALEIIKNLVNRYNEKLLKLIEEKLAQVNPLLDEIRPKEEAVLPEKIDGGSIQITNKGITYNGKIIVKQASKDIGLTYTDDTVFVFDGQNILKCYVKNGFLQKDVVCPSSHNVYLSIYGYKGIITFQKKDEYGIYIYVCETGKESLMDGYAYQLCGSKGKLFYTRIGREKNLYASKDLIMCDYDGGNSRSLEHYSGGSEHSTFYGVYNLRLEGDNLKYKVTRHDWSRGGKDTEEEKVVKVDDLINDSYKTQYGGLGILGKLGVF